MSVRIIGLALISLLYCTLGFWTEPVIDPLPVRMPAVYDVAGEVRLYDGTSFRWSVVSVWTHDGATVLYVLQLDDAGRYHFPAQEGDSFLIKGEQVGYAYAPPQIELVNISGDRSFGVLMYAGPNDWFPVECNAVLGEIETPQISGFTGPAPEAGPQGLMVDYGNRIPVDGYAVVSNGQSGSQYHGIWGFRGSLPTNKPCFKDLFVAAVLNQDGTCCTWTTSDSPFTPPAQIQRRIWILPAPSPTPSPTPTPTPTPTATPTVTPTPVPTATPTPTPSPTATPTPSPTPKPSPSPSPTPCRRLPNGKCRKS